MTNNMKRFLFVAGIFLAIFAIMVGCTYAASGHIASDAFIAMFIWDVILTTFLVEGFNL